MKILSLAKIREADLYTIENEPIKSIDLMERAAFQCVKWILNRCKNSEEFVVFAGQGNNGGDGLAIARMLAENKKKVRVYVLKISNLSSDDFKTNYERLVKTTVDVKEIESKNELPKLSQNAIIIDAIFGSGLSHTISGIAEQTISFINSQNNQKIAIDIPSGLFVDDNSNNLRDSIVKADVTLTFQFPKLPFLLAENHEFVGDWIVLDIGLHNDFISYADTENFYLERQDINLKPRDKFAHKGSFGHGLLIAGSIGKMGSAVLASKACLRSGIGLLTSYIPKNGLSIIQSSVHEAMAICDTNENYISDIPSFEKFSAIAIGPGLSQEKDTFLAFKKLISTCNKPLVIDADGLNLLSKDQTLYKLLPQNTILTPHKKEFERLFGQSKSDMNRHILQKEMSKKYKIIIVLKGSNTSISLPDGETWFNSTGNNGMATAGSGDVLTGIILSLLAQNYNSEDAAKIGVYIHGLAGDFSLKNQSHESLIAGDIVENLGNAFNFVKK
ncbi:MAG TPA: bifunctional ADP-dependent NAD(P)H-hydrate dehydratase/NAD(P)H-hydrate epimerase [Bacteroidales bacterium]|nr:MAG: hypothetical protein A2W98_10645 [Bacteroidetes bacterium GWF2_33_38]OFY75496.1 MAG: hypothetical protein A2265_03410 [Bacteroidetes bacterium RIFOXYA12_FULL_33_9]OFY85458.1 MAG: hypothetical protein A2236_11590 [Bacteroidetes bacterium RIFOXYA2_FULL_33_7]HBF87855.1 bifunctional ADP-dependent NAD(P)H-hydrate dehydratase/NAD(P)H-hydrate epimerase [Bacteroidales bacterium]